MEGSPKGSSSPPPEGCPKGGVVSLGANVSTHVFAPESLRPEGARYLAQGKRHKNFMAAPPWV